MDIRDGRIYTPEQWKKMLENAKRFKDPLDFLVPMIKPPTEKQLLRKPFPKVGRNESCPCGSGKKFKKCCLNLL